MRWIHALIDAIDHHVPTPVGKRRGPDAEKALDWLEKAGKQVEGSSSSPPDEPKSVSESEPEEPPPSEEEVRELWYARALACLRVDQGLQEGAVVEGEEWSEEVETERYGAKTGVEFVRVVRRRANRLRQARSGSRARGCYVAPTNLPANGWPTAKHLNE